MAMIVVADFDSLYSRAYIIGNVNKPSDRFVYLVLDIANGDTAIRYGVVNALKSAGLGIYNQSNVALTGTHSHSGPGAFNNYLLPQITTLGFSKQSYQAIVDGYGFPLLSTEAKY
tara:strand:+ start:308 stop:652 length:345 start_codon:yes stop_codon:yes gene_type:complete